MQDKIEFYKDILLADPLSRVFFPLSLALKEQNQLQEAAHYLEQGLIYHTNFLEARIFYIEILSALNEKEKQNNEIEKVVTIFKKYSHFWTLWAEKESAENEDCSLALSFVAHTLFDSSITLKKVFAHGIEALSASSNVSEKNLHSSSIHEVSQSASIATDVIVPMQSVEEVSTNLPINDAVEQIREDIPKNTLSIEVLDDEMNAHTDEEEAMLTCSLDTTVNTRSMADLLAEQGELEKALVIYKELLELENDIEVKAELKFIIQEFELRLKEENTTTEQKPLVGSNNKEKLINTLATLVSRLDARADAIQTQA